MELLYRIIFTSLYATLNNGDFFRIYVLTLSSCFLAFSRSHMRLLFRVGIRSLFANNFFGLGGRLCLVVLGSPNAFVLVK